MTFFSHIINLKIYNYLFAMQYVKEQPVNPTNPKHVIPNSRVALSAYKLMDTIFEDKNVKTVETTVPFQNEFSLYDVSMNASVQDEDKLYAFNEWYRINIRIGNTIIRQFEKSGKVVDTFYGRRGFEKSFDLTYEYVEYNLGEIKDLGNFGIKGKDEHIGLHQVIFENVEKSIKNGNKISVYKLSMPNGENAQISWLSCFNAWIIASKNVSLLARTTDDVDQYQGERFHFAKLIAKEWFKIADRLQKDCLLEEFKKYFEGKTFVAEYCGNQAYQHLVKYTEVDLYFIAIVENSSVVTCLPPTETLDIFEKFRLTHVKCTEMGTFQDWVALNKTLKKKYIDVAEASIESEGQGSVIYMVQTTPDGKRDVLSLSKLKTLEYRIYRKLREKLRNFISQPGKYCKPWKEYQTKFRKETEDLAKELKPPMPLDYYFRVGELAFEFAENHFKQSSLIHEQYITFLSLLMHQMSKNQKLTPELFSEETIKKVLPIPWAEYERQYNLGKGDRGRIGESPDQAVQTKRVYVFVPIGIPGMGKKYFLETLKTIVEEHGCLLSIISSNEIRKESMDRLAKTNRKLTTDELFDKTDKDAKNVFNERLANLLTSGDKENCKSHFIFIDRNHPPNAITGTVKFILDHGEGLNVEIIALTPLVDGNFYTYEDQDRAYAYPFSANFFFHCFDRVQTRKEHLTLTGSGTKSASVMMMFLHMFRNVKLNKQSVLKNGFHKQLRVPFTAEDSPITIPDELLDALHEILRSMKLGDVCKQPDLLSKLNSEYEKSKLKFSNPDPKKISDSVSDFFNTEVFPDLDVLASKAKEPTSIAKSTNQEEHKTTDTDNKNGKPATTPAPQKQEQAAPKKEETVVKKEEEKKTSALVEELYSK